MKNEGFFKKNEFTLEFIKICITYIEYEQYTILLMKLVINSEINVSNIRLMFFCNKKNIRTILNDIYSIMKPNVLTKKEGIGLIKGVQTKPKNIIKNRYFLYFSKILVSKSNRK